MIKDKCKVKIRKLILYIITGNEIQIKYRKWFLNIKENHKFSTLIVFILFQMYIGLYPNLLKLEEDQGEAPK
jgi:hypothetical protein